MAGRLKRLRCPHCDYRVPHYFTEDRKDRLWRLANHMEKKHKVPNPYPKRKRPKHKRVAQKLKQGRKKGAKRRAVYRRAA
jgi:predicted RNA-binding protein